MRLSNGSSIMVVCSVVLLLSGRMSSCLAASSGWTPNGVRVASADSAQLEPRIVPDGSGGAIIAWEDKRGGPFLAYAQRLEADGSMAPGWPAGGVLLPNRGLSQANLTAIADNAGGAYVASDDNGFTGAVLVHHLGADGAPATGWPPAAVALQIAPYGAPGGSQGAFLPALLADGAGGVFVSRTYRDRLYQSIALTRLTATGDFAPGWNSGAFAGLAGGPWEYPSLLCSDGEGGVYVTFQENHVPPRILIGRFDGAGGGLLAARALSSTGLGQTAPGLVSDGGTGAIVVWEDHRNGAFDQVYAQRILSDGAVAPGWPVDGLNICAFPTEPGRPSDFVFPGPISSVVSDGAGGAYVSWTDYRSGDGDIYALHVLGNGLIATGWPGNGLAVFTASGAQERPSIASDGSGGMIVTWQDRRNASDYNVYAQHVLADGTIAPGWSTGGLALCTAAGDQVAPVVATDAAGNALFAWADGRADASNIYAGRVAADPSPVAVEAPPRANLALTGAVPNPARRGGLAVRFELPDAEPAALEVLDVGGRRLALREVGALGVGSHTVDLGEAADLPAGVYLLRLTQASRTLVVKACVMR